MYGEGFCFFPGFWRSVERGNSGTLGAGALECFGRLKSCRVRMSREVVVCGFLYAVKDVGGFFKLSKSARGLNNQNTGAKLKIL